ncbi:Coiled-coil domain-containing protein 39 [Fasciolopsis buskii]|uniref:Coiled-coil domain-containing protein 39 n=1 Tax=Fasciolopsis buskii TaxID=27845 RepID=A0A8E0RNZ0_9TREM|nr:Coiled-coil domain-containing protein 39 [Fasciolopsis buski]
MEDGSKIMIEETLRETGWKTNYAFPVASTENAYLLKLLAEVKLKIRFLEEESADYKEKNCKLRTHLQMVQQERANTEALLLERQRECDAAQHQLCLAEREIGRTKQDLHELKIKRGEIHVRMGSLENEIFVKSNELNSIKSQMDYDQQLIEVYLDACEEDVRCRERLDALKMSDESRMAVLNSECAKLSEKRRAIREKLDNIVMKNDVLRLRFSAASEQCRSENQARREVLGVWENILCQMVRRDEEYTNLSRKYDELMGEIKKQNQIMEEVKKMSKMVADDVKKAEQAITDSNKEIFDRKNDYDKAFKEAQTMSEEVAVKALTSCPHSLFYPFLNRKASFLSRTHRFQDETKKTTAAEKQLAEVTSRRLNDEQLMKMVEEKFAADEKCYKNIVAYNQQLVNSSLKVAQDLIKLDELIYKAQLFNLRLEQRIAKLESGPILSHEEFAMKNKQIAAMQNDLELRTKTCNSLMSMINQFMNDRQICIMRSEKLQAELDKVKTELVTAQLTLSNSAIALRKAESAWREMLVECNLNKHQVKRMEARLNLLRNAVMCEEAKQLHLDSLERQAGVEIENRKNNIMLEIRQTEARLADTRAELTTRLRRLDHIRGRYNVTVTALAQSNEDAMGARMRYLIEKSQGAPIEKEKQFLETKLTDLQTQLSSQRKQRRKLRSDILNFEILIEEVDSVLKLLHERYQTGSTCMVKAVKAAEETKSRYDRISRRLAQIKESMDRYVTSNELDIATRLLRDFNRLIYHLYDRCLRTSPCATDALLSEEQVLVDNLQFARPPGFTPRITNTSRTNQERRSAKGLSRQVQPKRMGVETKRLSVVSIGDKVELPPNALQHQDNQEPDIGTCSRPESSNKRCEQRSHPK